MIDPADPFVSLVTRLREEQKRYCKIRTPQGRARVTNLEKEVDRLLDSARDVSRKLGVMPHPY